MTTRSDKLIRASEAMFQARKQLCVALDLVRELQSQRCEHAIEQVIKGVNAVESKLTDVAR